MAKLTVEKETVHASGFWSFKINIGNFGGSYWGEDGISGQSFVNELDKMFSGVMLDWNIIKNQSTVVPIDGFKLR